jgi:NarL family two-component system response regulator LiaR
METKKILVVEDEPMIRRALVEKISEEKSFIVMSTKDGKEGLEAALREHPDFILLDLVMPVMDGMEMLSHLREDEWGKKARVMFLSNLADSEKVAEGVAKGVHEFMIKSNVDVSGILAHIKKEVLGEGEEREEPGIIKK